MRFVFGIQVPGDTEAEAECPGDPVTQWSGCPLDTVDTGGTPWQPRFAESTAAVHAVSVSRLRAGDGMDISDIQ